MFTGSSRACVDSAAGGDDDPRAAGDAAAAAGAGEGDLSAIFALLSSLNRGKNKKVCDTDRQREDGEEEILE